MSLRYIGLPACIQPITLPVARLFAKLASLYGFQTTAPTFAPARRVVPSSR